MSDGDRESLADPTAGCRDGFRFACGYGCDKTWRSTDFADIARRAARHLNEDHSDELANRFKRIETVERGGHHVHENTYQVERIGIYLTPFDTAERAGLVDGFLPPADSDRVCDDCCCVIPDRGERVEDDPDDPFSESWTCSQCRHEEEIAQREQENEQLTEWSA